PARRSENAFKFRGETLPSTVRSLLIGGRNYLAGCNTYTALSVPLEALIFTTSIDKRGDFGGKGLHVQPFVHRKFLPRPNGRKFRNLAAEIDTPLLYLCS